MNLCFNALLHCIILLTEAMSYVDPEFPPSFAGQNLFYPQLRSPRTCRTIIDLIQRAREREWNHTRESNSNTLTSLVLVYVSI